MDRTGIIVDYDNNNMEMPGKIIEMGLLPNTPFRILYQAPFGGPVCRVWRGTLQSGITGRRS